MDRAHLQAHMAPPPERPARVPLHLLTVHNYRSQLSDEINGYARQRAAVQGCACARGGPKQPLSHGHVHALVHVGARIHMSLPGRLGALRFEVAAVLLRNSR